MPDLIENFDRRYLLGQKLMDETHRAFVNLVNRLGKSGKEEFVELFAKLVIHTEAHFDQENRWMEESGFPATREHIDEHQRVLGELNRFAQRVASDSVIMGQAYITQQLPQWFDLHAKTMDSALAAHLRLMSTNFED
jgi:hemerythrin-like metal-binding protein